MPTEKHYDATSTPNNPDAGGSETDGAESMATDDRVEEVYVLSVRHEETGGEWEVVKVASSVTATQDRIWKLLKAHRRAEIRCEPLPVDHTISRPEMDRGGSHLTDDADIPDDAPETGWPSQEWIEWVADRPGAEIEAKNDETYRVFVDAE